MTRVLALETGSDWCSVALADSSGRDVDLRWRAEHAPRRHGERLLPMARTLLAEAGWSLPDLDAVAVGRGPGAFTGVRLGFAAAQGLAFALDRPLVPVSSLAGAALGAVDSWADRAAAPDFATRPEAHDPESMQLESVAKPRLEGHGRFAVVMGQPSAPPTSSSNHLRGLDVGRQPQRSRRPLEVVVWVVRDARMGEAYSGAYLVQFGPSVGTQAAGGEVVAFSPLTMERLETPAMALQRLTSYGVSGHASSRVPGRTLDRTMHRASHGDLGSASGEVSRGTTGGHVGMASSAVHHSAEWVSESAGDRAGGDAFVRGSGDLEVICSDVAGFREAWFEAREPEAVRKTVVSSTAWPQARDIARLALSRPLDELGCEAWRAEPIYHRDRVAETRQERAIARQQDSDQRPPPELE
ncbi:MAG: tRNA (adenosine(37)-N6)-threonylcarbamoyltransferase complex dimerization subunit type 1 TsaB [Thioalkalivibrionaceae bacterium]